MPLADYRKKIRGKLHLRNRKKSQIHELETGPNPATAGASNVDTPTNLDGSSSPAPPLNESLVPSPPLVDGDTHIRELWNIAYEKLRVDDEALILEYEAKTCVELSSGLITVAGSKLSLQDRTHATLQRKMNEMNDATWKLKFGSTEVQVRDVVKPVLGVVSRANSFISSIASSNPYASLAWMGVSVLLPIFLNPPEQIASLVSGLDYISSLITHSHMWEDLYMRRYESEASTHKSTTTSHIAYKKSLEELYRHILKFQARSYCYYAHSSGSRLGLDILKWNENKEDAFSTIRESWKDNNSMKNALRQWRDIGGHIAALQEAVRKAQDEKQRDTFLDWLCEVDPSEVYNIALGSMRVARRSPSSVLWLHGKPGCGKSVLSSSVVHHLTERYRLDPSSPIAYFFFSFTDSKKQKVDTMLSSLIRQLYMSRPDKPKSVDELCTSYREKRLRPDTKMLEAALIDITRGFSSAYLVIDGLDECPDVDGERSRLLASVSRIVRHKIPDNVHIFLASRLERDIGIMMRAIFKRPHLCSVAIDLTSDQGGINHDIGLYIDSRLVSGHFDTWPDYVKSKAKRLLLRRADGMFQYIVCQFQELERLGSIADIDEALEKLPSGLYATYDRALQNIDPRFRAQVVNMLKWLVASTRPLLLEELAETWILRPQDPVPFDVSRRLFKPEDCINYASNLLVLYNGWEGDTYVRLAHFSVKEYLISDNSTNSQTPWYSFTEVDAHRHIVDTSLHCHLHCSELAEKI
ncbi:hypothetical protein RRF57_008878 [Xylaria bambusicola]|uniref:NWD NACHT-NTPase N-terminal domain-containing protein n=1 Tax=Xylaria bambusicola TaxID=326684 RepID=A0AAN7UYP4_9PEZI